MQPDRTSGCRHVGRCRTDAGWHGHRVGCGGADGCAGEDRMSGCGWEVGRAGCTYSLSLSLCVTARHPLWMPCRWNRGCDTRSATVSDAEDSAKASSSASRCWKMLVSVSEGTGAAPCAVASCGAAPGRVSSDGVRTDVGVTGGPMFAGVTSESLQTNPFRAPRHASHKGRQRRWSRR